MQTSGCTCQICNTKLTCPQCNNVNAMNNELADIKSKIMELRNHVDYCLFAIIIVLAAIVLALLYPSFTNTCISPKDCYAAGEGLKMAVVGERANANVYIIDKRGQDCTYTTKVTCDGMHQITGKRVHCEAKKSTGNQYEIEYQPVTPGRHQLHIKVEGEHIQGSPFTVTVMKNLNTPIKIISKLNGPYGTSVNQRGEILVAEKKAHCVSIFSPEGVKLQSFGSEGLQPGNFKEPHGVAVSDNGDVIVTDYNHRVQKFSNEYKLIKNVGKLGNGNLQFDHPLNVAISPTTKIIAVPEWGNYRVQILNPDLTFNSSIGNQGSGNGQFLKAYDVAFDSGGNVYVTDAENHCIQVFTPEGKFLRKFGKKGEGHGELNYPAGMSIDSDDTVYVVNGHNHCVSVFTPEGEFLKSFGSRGDGPGQFDDPRVITMNKNGKIYVTERGNKRIQIF